MFADWAAGLLDTTPDPLTSERHVASMVEVGSMFVKLGKRLFLSCLSPLCQKRVVDEGLTLETSAFESLYGGQFTSCPES